MKNTRASGWVVMVGLVSASALGGCDLVAGIGEFCEIGVDPGCGTGGTGGAGGGGTGGTTTSPTGGGGTGGASGCSPMGTEQPCYSGPDGTQDVGICVGGTQTCQADGTWGLCEGQVEPGIETCASTDDEDCDAKECALWSKIFGDASSQHPFDVAIDAQGNVVVLGNFKGKVTFGGEVLESAGENDLFLAKFNSGGEHVWSAKYGDVKNQVFASMALDSGGNIIIAGTFEGTLDFGAKALTAIAGGTDVFVAKLTPNGALAWANRYGDAAPQSAWGVAVDSGDDVLAIGEFAGSMLLKDNITATNGTDVWVGRFDGSNGNAAGQFQLDDKAGQSATLSIATGPAGSWAISGVHGNGAFIGNDMLNGFGAFVAKYGPDDAPLWSTHIAVSSTSDIVIGSTGDVVLAGDFINTVDVGGIMLTSKGIADVAIIRLGTLDGGVKWAKSYGGDGNEQATRLAMDASDNIYFTLGADSSAIHFGGDTLLGKGLSDLFIVALKGDGAHRWSRAFGDAATQLASTLAIDPEGTALVLAGRASGTVDFGAGDLNSNGDDIALAKLAP